MTKILNKMPYISKIEYDVIIVFMMSFKRPQAKITSDLEFKNDIELRHHSFFYMMTSQVSSGTALHTTEIFKFIIFI